MTHQKRIEEWLTTNSPGRGAGAAELRAELAAHLEAAMLKAREAGAIEEAAFEQVCRELGDTKSLRRWLRRRQLLGILQPRYCALVLVSCLTGLLCSAPSQIELHRFSIIPQALILRPGSFIIPLFAIAPLVGYALFAGFKPLQFKASLAAAWISLFIMQFALGINLLLIGTRIEIPLHYISSALPQPFKPIFIVSWLSVWLIFFLIPCGLVQAARFVAHRLRPATFEEI